MEGPTIIRPGFQIRSRSQSHDAGYGYLETIRDRFDGVLNVDLDIMDATIRILAIFLRSDILSIGQETDSHNRHHFSINFTFSQE